MVKRLNEIGFISTVFFMALLCINVSANNKTLDGGGGNIYTDSFETAFNVAKEFNTYDLPVKIDLYLDNKLIGSGSPKQEIIADFPELTLKINVPCTDFPKPELVVWNDPLSLKAYGFDESRVKFVVHYADNSTLDLSSQAELIYVSRTAGLADNESKLMSVCPGLQDTNNNSGLKDIAGTTFEKYIQKLYDAGVINGYSDHTYRPTEKVTRLAMAKYIVKAFDLTVDTSGEKFADVTDMNNELNQYVQTLKNLKIITGYSDKTYRPNELVSRAAVTKFVVNAMVVKGIAVDFTIDSTFSDVPSNYPFRAYIAYLNSVSANGEKVIKGTSDGRFLPSDNLDRGAMAKIISNAKDSYPTLPKGNPIGDPLAVIKGDTSELLSVETSLYKFLYPAGYSKITTYPAMYIEAYSKNGNHVYLVVQDVDDSANDVDNAWCLAYQIQFGDQFDEYYNSQASYFEDNGYKGCKMTAITSNAGDKNVYYGYALVNTSTNKMYSVQTFYDTEVEKTVEELLIESVDSFELK